MAQSKEDNVAVTRYVAEAAQREMAEKARQRVPALRFGALAGTFGVLAAASTYRLNVLLLERKLPPELAALVAAAAYTGGAGCAAYLAARRWRGLPAPLPTETARQVAEIIADATD
jgi:Putative Actinobacterial Holin-X, holin superfamily III